MFKIPIWKFIYKYKSPVSVSENYLNKFPDSKCSDWTDAEKCWELNQEVARMLFFVEEYAATDYENDQYDAG